MSLFIKFLHILKGTEKVIEIFGGRCLLVEWNREKPLR
jgi:hypothetical protein